jgi:putative membrane protein
MAFRDCRETGGVRARAMRLLLKILLNAAAILIAAYFMDGIVVRSAAAALIAGFVLGLVNAIVRPVLLILTLPITLVTLGLFIFVVNALCLALTAALVPGFEVAGFWSALGGALVVTIVSWILHVLLKEETSRGR